MKPYIAFSRAAGPENGAILILANSTREARVLAWRSGECWNADGWLDLGVRWLRDDDVLMLADQAKLAAGMPHVVALPVPCEDCGLWGCGLQADGETCCHCGQYAGDVLVEVVGQ